MAQAYAIDDKVGAVQGDGDGRGLWCGQKSPCVKVVAMRA